MQLDRDRDSDGCFGFASCWKTEKRYVCRDVADCGAFGFFFFCFCPDKALFASDNGLVGNAGEAGARARHREPGHVPQWPEGEGKDRAAARGAARGTTRLRAAFAPGRGPQVRRGQSRSVY